MSLVRESSNDAVGRLVAAGVEIAREQGLGAMTSRALALRTGLSPSALNYHLGGREALVGQVLDAALQASSGWRVAQLAAIADEGGAPAWISPVGVVAATIADRVGAFRGWTLLLAEFAAEAEVGQDPRLTSSLAQEAEAMAGFWRTVAGAIGQDEGAAQIWTDFAFGLTHLLLGDEPLAAKAPWIVDSTARVHARLHGHAMSPLSERSIGAAERLHGQAPASESARRLLDAALKVMAEKGAERLTQRDVAAAAGLSLAATTYFFRTKAELVTAAFHELHRQVSDQALQGGEAGRTLLRSTLEGESERDAWRVRAMEALQLRSARDASLAPIAREMRTTRGATSIRWLRSIGLEVDRLDAFVYSTAMSGVVQRTRFSPAGERRGAMAKAEALLLAGLFDRQDFTFT